MGLLGSTEFNTLEDLLKHQLEDIYDAEKRLTNALPKMRDKATNTKLKTAFGEHLEETKVQVKRLEQAFEKLGWEAKRETCPAMKGLIKEGEEMIDAKGDVDVIDAALIASAQRVEHYEIAAYGSARCQASAMGRDDIADLLQQTLDEEHSTDSKLADLATEVINPKAAV